MKGKYLNIKLYYCNFTFLYRKVETMEKLEDWRLERIQDLATLIQKIWKGYKARYGLCFKRKGDYKYNQQ